MVNQVFSVGQKSDFNVQGAENVLGTTICFLGSFFASKCMWA